MRVTFKGY